jgi:hypothetical protein
MEAIERLHLTISPHLIYSPHSVPRNFHLFPDMKEGLSGPGSGNNMWSSVMTALRERDWSIVGGSVWRMVVMMWRGE